MNPETTPVTIDTPYGVLYVAVMDAMEDSFHDSERGNVTELRPRLRVASDPTFKADPDHADHWTIRRRAYALHHTVYLWDRRKHDGGLWHRESSPYRGGFRNDRRDQVGFWTATYDLMDAALSTALDTFAAKHEGWEELSRYLLLKYKHDREVSQAESLWKEAGEHAAKAVDLAGEVASVFDVVSADLRSLLKG